MIEASDFQGVFTPNGVKSRFARLFRDDRAVPAVRYCASTMSKLIAIAVLVAFASPAEAYSSVTTWGCKYSGYYGYSNCRRTYTELPDPVRDPEQERQDALARKQADEKWDAFCKPKFASDEYGVRRASYAATGCEFGRSE